jgi:spore germination cell wall hydrolase CwlJ-like protein
MNGKILALLLGVVLTGAPSASQARDPYMFIASAGMVAEVQNNAVLPPTTGRDDSHKTTLTQVPAAIASWKHTFKTMFDPRIVAQSCLATAIYFEARSESQLGQLAVATVILNRAKMSIYPSSICGVVYQGTSRLNACQFSFACDGHTNLPPNDRAWETAVAIAALALDVAAATHYHADYVDPSWSRSLHRLTKIGRHIFYSQG